MYADDGQRTTRAHDARWAATDGRRKVRQETTVASTKRVWHSAIVVGSLLRTSRDPRRAHLVSPLNKLFILASDDRKL